jgi:hypothetical protein
MRKRLQKLHFSFKLEGVTKPREITRPPRRASAGAAIPRFALYSEAPHRWSEHNRPPREGLPPASPPELAT